MAIYKQDDGKGYLVVSSQGNDSYALFRREGDSAYVGSFRIGADIAAGIDGVSETDGLDVTSRAAGPGIPRGLMGVQEGRKVSQPENQKFKLVPWERIAEALGLEERADGSRTTTAARKGQNHKPLTTPERRTTHRRD